MALIHANGLTKSYGEVKVLKGVDLAIESGEVVSIVGASGAGKTTLLQILGTLDKPDSGSLSIDNTEVFSLKDQKLSEFRNKRIGFVFQFHQLLPEFSAIENAALPGYIAGMSKAEAEKRAAELMSFLKVDHRMQHKPSALSGGEQQRIAVARALLNKPSVVLADEPSGNLDSANAEELHKLFFDLRDEFGQTFIIVTHNPSLAEMADRKLTIADGIIAS